ncbi:MAG: class I SAM-dependent methyltransferase [Syntrophaceae bacterium]|nr:class I SAM-dependent methyltransferase [Syntrophaceae bacterium]
MIKNLLLHPLTRGLDVDDPATTEVRRRIIRSKPFLHRIYEEWYTGIVACLPGGEGPVVELGSGAGHLEDFLPGVVKTEILPCPHVAVVLDAGFLPFSDTSVRALVMTDVFHHLPKPEAFLREAARCLRPGGSVLMIEPWVTAWSRFVYRRLHPEPFEPDAESWEFPSKGPLSGANSALPWIVFGRDRDRFQAEFPLLRLESVEPMMPILYLLSGGVSLRNLQPGWTFPLWRSLEQALKPLWPSIAMFARIVLRRIDGADPKGNGR